MLKDMIQIEVKIFLPSRKTSFPFFSFNHSIFFLIFLLLNEMDTFAKVLRIQAGMVFICAGGCGN